jgi:CHAT domain-containing protein
VNQLGAQLSKLLLSPVSGLLGSNKLLIVADGPLQRLPFAALQDPVDPHGRALGLVREIAYLPSVTSIAALREKWEAESPRPTGLAVLADPVFRSDDPRLSSPMNKTGATPTLLAATRAMGYRNIPRLLYSRKEGLTIAAYASDSLQLFDFNASREAVTQGLLRNKRILHFAAHGFANLEDPELSGLVLSLVDRFGKPQNGFLRFQDIYEQQFNAELVVLSACQTAIGKNFNETGMMTLAGAFLHAGAASVLSTLWKIDDESTAEFMRIYYRELMLAGASPSAALRTAQAELARVPRWKSPYYWAAFVLQGWPH